MLAESFYYKVMKPEIKKFHEEIMGKINSNKKIKNLYTGWKVWFSPIIDSPDILFIGINPGPGENGELILEPDDILQYTYDKSNWKLKNDTLEVFRSLDNPKVDLEKCVKTNYYYLGTKNCQDIQTITDFLDMQKDKNGLGRTFYQNSQKWTRQILSIIKPKLIVCEGKQAFELLTKYALNIKVTPSNEDVFTHYCENLSVTVIGYERIYSNIKNKDLLTKRLAEFFS